MVKNKLKEIVVAVAGNPNCGKSTLINAIAGSKLQVGNWPGVTVERTTAEVVFEDIKITFIDLPGTYSLDPFSQEEIIASLRFAAKCPERDGFCEPAYYQLPNQVWACCAPTD